MSNPQAPINNTINAGNPAALPTHCFIAVSNVSVAILLLISLPPQTHTGMNGSRHNTVVPVPRDPPAPNVMDPALRIGLYNPNPYVRGMAVGPIAKMGGASVMRRAEVERSNARRFVRRLEVVRPDGPANLAVLTNDELAAYEELINEEQPEEQPEAEEEGKERGGEGGPAEKQQQQKKKKVRIRYLTLPSHHSTTPPPPSLFFYFKDERLANPTSIPQQARPEPRGTAWFVQRGKELDSKRIY